jgi:hypothetical protein
MTDPTTINSKEALKKSGMQQPLHGLDTRHRTMNSLHRQPFPGLGDIEYLALFH